MDNQWYREENGDYLVVDPEGERHLTARVTNIEGMPESMVTSVVSRTYLENCCALVPTSRVPAEWLPWGQLEEPRSIYVVGDIDQDIPALKQRLQDIVAVGGTIVSMGDSIDFVSSHPAKRIDCAYCGGKH